MVQRSLMAVCTNYSLGMENIPTHLIAKCWVKR